MLEAENGVSCSSEIKEDHQTQFLFSGASNWCAVSRFAVTAA